MIEPPAGPRMEWALDLMPDLPATLSPMARTAKRVHIIIAVDAYSKFVLIAALPDKSSNTIAWFVRDKLISVFGLPC